MSIILSLCDYSGNIVKPWVEAGYECWIVDIKHPAGVHQAQNLVTVGADIRSWLPPREYYRAVFAFPPCTNLAVSGARWFKEKGLAGLARGLELVERCLDICEWAEAPYFIENPVSTLSTYWRKPDYSFNPCDYGGYLDPPGDAYTKKTCLWCGNGFVLPEPKAVVPIEGSRMHLLPPSEERAAIRSETPMGFARAVYEANGLGSTA